MNSVPVRGCLVIAALVAALAAFAGTAAAQGLGDLNGEINQISAQMSSALSNASTAQSVVDRLDHAEADFARIAASPKANRAELLPVFDRLEQMLSQLHEAYQKKKDDCISQIDNGGAQCDYTAPEQIALAAAYPLAWLRFQGATTAYVDNAEHAKRLLNQAIDDFTQSTLVMPDPNLVRENVLGRAYCERELGKYDKSEYDKAIQDFKQIMGDGPNTKQYKAAQQGLATTYAAMGNPDEAKRYSGNLGTGGGAEMFNLQNTYAAMYATHDASKRAQYLKEIVETARAKENDKDGWAVAIAAIVKYSHNPADELGNSPDPFQKHLLANVLLAKKDTAGAAKYFLEAAHTGKYPKDYKFAADIYYNQHNMAQVEAILNDMSKQPGNPDAQWASYMRFKLPRLQWEQSGMKNAVLETQWVNAANDYLKSYPHGEYAFEPRFRLAERLQQNKQYVEAAQQYAQVTGNPDYAYTAKFNQAECDYLALVAAANAASNKNAPAPAVDRDKLRQSTIADLQEALRMEPGAERAASAAQHSFIKQTKGRAIYMLASLLTREPKVDYRQLVDLLNGYESQYPSMTERFNEVSEWRITALDKLGRYDELEQQVRGVLERSKGSTAQTDFIKELGLDFWRTSQNAKAAGDQNGFAQNAKLTAVAYEYFEDLVQANKMPAKNLTGTLSILGQAYIAQGDVAKAEGIFNQVVKADPGSPDANAGLARIAQAKKDYKDAVESWTRVESVAAESDDLWYEAKYNVAAIYAAQGNIKGACDKLAVTRSEHPSLGTPEMKAQWDSLQRRICLTRQAGG